jgi:hypothetical protein
MRWRAAMLAAAVAVLAGAGTAHAGTYAVVACNAPGGGGANHSWRFGYSGGAGRADFSVIPTNNCPGSNGSQILTATGAATVPGSARAALTFTAPPGDAVTHVTVWRLGQARAGWQVASRIGSRLAGHCRGTATAYCTVGALGFSERSRRELAVVPPAPAVSWGLECVATKCATAKSGAANARLDFQGARVTVSDPVAPSAGAGGALLAGGFRRSGEPATVTATDASGIRSLALLVDGAVRSSVAEHCDFRLAAPCPAAASATLSPGALTDGTHAVTLEAVDAGGNVGRVDHAVVVDGSPPDAVLSGIDGRRITVAVSDRVSGVTGGQLLVRTSATGAWTPLATSLAHGRLTAVAPRAARGLGLRVVASDGAGNVLDAVVTSLRLWAHVGGRRHGGWVRHGRMSVPYGRAVSLSGVLATTDGVPLAHQAVAITGRQHRLGARTRRLDVATTDAHGRFRLRLRAGASRTVSVAYSGAPALLRRTTAVALRVAAWASIHASPRVLYGRGRVRFSGRLGLRDAHVPRSGKLIDVEAFDAGRWRIFATARARGRHGVWRASNVFSGRPGRFPIRVRIRRESTFPYELGYSRSVTVVVR